jgi:hypothetical protein
MTEKYYVSLSVIFNKILLYIKTQQRTITCTLNNLEIVDKTVTKTTS